jgi:cytochrome P450
MNATSVKGRVAPGPPGLPVIGNARGFQKDIIQTLLDGFRQYGDVVRFRGLGPLFPVFLFAHPDYVMHALKDNSANYPKTPFINDKWRMVVGEGLICSKGDFWQRQRRLAQPSFDPKLLRSFDGVIVEETETLLEEWRPRIERGEPIDVAREMVHLALMCLGQAMFSTDWRREAKVMGPAVHDAIGYAYKLIESFVTVPENIPTPGNRRFKQARRTLEEIMERMIARRHEMKEQPADLLGTLMTAELENGERMDDLQVRSELMTFMFGGHETVASGLAWTWYLLSKHPDVQRRLVEEVDEVLQGRTPTADDIQNLEYTTMVINESLRLYPPVWLISRTPVADDVVGGYEVPAGSMVLISSLVSHRHPDMWEDPEGFDPERWTPERSEGRSRNAWFPFSGGPRQCIGGFFGLIEMHLVISYVLQRYRLEIVPHHPVHPRPGITLGFKQGLMMTVHPRESREDGGVERAAEAAAGAPAA